MQDAVLAYRNKIPYSPKSLNKLKQPKENVKWQPPKEGMYKMNYDGAVFTDLGEAGIRVIVRDARGEVIAILAKKVLHPDSVEVLEALAARRAAKFAVELGLIILFSTRRRCRGGVQGVADCILGSLIHWRNCKRHCLL